MRATTARQRRARCKNCDSPSAKLGRLLVQSPSGKKLTLLICRFCYLQLSQHAVPH